MHFTLTIPKLIRQAIRLIPFIILIIAGIGCILYMSLSWTTLKEWYLSLACFYNSDTWSSNFFTPEVKTSGNIWAAGGLAAVSTLLYNVYNHTKELPAKIRLYLTQQHIWEGAIVIAAASAAIYEWTIMPPAYDEIFSAVNCAEMPPFITWSYYMLPNNHVLFNLTNNLLFSWLHNSINTGRIISIAAYAGSMVVAFRLLVRLTHKHIFAFIAVIPVALQFTAWGMSAQARGYECQLFCGWLAFSSLPGIAVSQQGNTRILIWANILGFAFIPSWFYFYVAQLLFISIPVLKNDIPVKKQLTSHIIVICTVLCFYLPVILFSGSHSLSGNRYVRPVADVATFIPDLLPYMRDIIAYCFSYLAHTDTVGSYIFFFLPVVLLFSNYRTDKLLALFHISMCICFVGVGLYIRHIPFHRTLITQFSIAIALSAYALFFLVQRLSSLIRQKNIATSVIITLFCIPLTAYGVYLARYNQHNVNFVLYANDVNGIYRSHKDDIAKMQPHSSVACSPESFYFFYHCRKSGFSVSRCSSGKENYYVKRIDEPMPYKASLHYILAYKGGEDYEIYKRQ